MKHRAYLLCFFAALTLPLQAQDLTIYDDDLAAGFQDWSWAVHDLANTAPVAAGSRSISFEADSWTGLYFKSDAALNLADWSDLRLSIHGGPAGGQSIRLLFQMGSAQLGTIALDPAPAGSWQTRTLSLRDAGLAVGTFDGIILQDATGSDQATLYLDQVLLIRDDAPPPPAEEVAVTIDPGADRRPINPLIYGVAFGDADRLAAVGYPIRRWGGNSVTRYNWKTAVHNTAFDYFFQNIVDEVADPNLLPHGSSSDIFVDEALGAGAEVLMTAPAIGWTPLDERAKKWSFSVQKYGPQLEDECSFYDPNPPSWCAADSGNGRCDPSVNTTGFCSPDGLITGNDPTDTSQAITSTFVTDWVQHLISRVGNADSGGVRFWAVDNEPMLWNSTHRDLITSPLTYDELWSRTLDVAGAIKSADPGAQVMGPVVWGWCAYFSSASDAAFPNGSCIDGPDRQAHDGLPLLEWYLKKVCEEEQASGVRPIDYLDLHVYPQGNVAGLGGASSSEDPETAARRLRSVRELWDPTYVSESWVADTIQLIPRVRSWIDARCPDVKLAITEYRWGGDGGASSAVAHAEVLALFGREGVDLATRWVAPEANSPVEDAFRLFLSYDNAGARISGDSIRAVSDNGDDLGTYAVADDQGNLWTLLMNRGLLPLDARVSVVGGLEAGTAPVYRFDGGTRLGVATTVAVSDGAQAFELELPPRSVTMVPARLSLEAAIFADGFESADVEAWSSSLP